MSARTVLLAAADEIERVGWRGAGSFLDPGLDVHTAIRDAAGVVWNAGEDAFRAVYAYLRHHPKLANGESESLNDWNRHCCPDQATAVAVLRGAAEMAGAR